MCVGIVEYKYVHSIDSTNDYLKQYAHQIKKHMCLIAAKQTQGKGRCGRSFVSDENKGLYMSLLVYEKIPLNDGLIYTAKMAVSVCHVLKEKYGIDVQIKWVNDLQINGKKLGGILCEGSIQDSYYDYLVIGVGVNYAHDHLDDELKSQTTSLFEQGLNKIDSQIFAREIVETFMEHRHDDSWYEAYLKRSNLLNQDIIIYRKHGNKVGRVITINRKGELVVQIDDHIEVICSDEVSIRKTPSTLL